MSSPFASPFATALEFPTFDVYVPPDPATLIKRRLQQKLRQKINKYVNAHIHMKTINLNTSKSLASYEKSMYVSPIKQHLHIETVGTLMVSKKKPYRVRFNDKANKIYFFKKNSKPLIEIFGSINTDNDNMDLLYI